MSATPIAIPPLLTALIGHLAAAVPARARTTFTELAPPRRAASPTRSWRPG
jgi:hypothetical protein